MMVQQKKTVVRNLLSNAIKFSKENSEVLVKMEEVDGAALMGERRKTLYYTYQLAKRKDLIL